MTKLATTVMTVEEYKALEKKKERKREETKREHPEHDEQVKVFEWAEIISNKHPELKLLMAIPNGASYGGGGGRWNIAKRMKAEGVRSGVPDIFLPVPRIEEEDTEYGLWIEMKAGKNKPSRQQEWWLKELKMMGYRTRVCYSAEEAIEEIQEYLNLDE